MDPDDDEEEEDTSDSESKAEGLRIRLSKLEMLEVGDSGTRPLPLRDPQLEPHAPPPGLPVPTQLPVSIIHIFPLALQNDTFSFSVSEK